MFLSYNINLQYVLLFKRICLVCACGECNGGGGGTTESLPSGSSSSADPISVAGASREATGTNNSSTSGQQNVHQQLESHNNDSTSVQSQLSEATKYAGLVYYEEKGVEDLVTFAASKDLNALVQYIEQRHSQAEIGQNVYFSFHPSRDYIELKLDHTPQKYPFNGWTIQSHFEPCELHRCDIDKFGNASDPIPPCCLLSVNRSPNAVPTLHYSIPLEGVVRPITLYIHRSLRTTNPSTSSSSNTITEVTAVSSNGGASVPASVDVKRVKKVINDVLVSHHASLTSLKTSLSDLASQLYTAGLISDEVKGTRSMDTFITEFKASLSFKRKLPQVEEHCQKFLSSFIAVRGSYADAAIALAEDWIEAVRKELEFDFNIDIDS
ncbi:PREDICTED: uncharacterized protein LOC109587155 [Amphimedon queenslandica]|uniref:Uncharacterized protein n=1 Tax=Amphimedon queenslandica TaxID=400682 RepID=A0AAN0JQ57_AMPQE|nr:PREDICTED: uncharacterized protein LOC109587155 [Amphimedon queenslandica]|eukprot:XP_019858951.1 PREDICTED: uncharacterized protein LOC109587155 [Amphimedon queenslandica]